MFSCDARLIDCLSNHQVQSIQYVPHDSKMTFSIGTWRQDEDTQVVGNVFFLEECIVFSFFLPSFSLFFSLLGDECREGGSRKVETVSLVVKEDLVGCWMGHDESGIQ